MFKPVIISFFLIGLIFACSPIEGAKQEKKHGKNSYEMAGDHTLGNPKAPVTVIEYASLTCVHCAHFHETVWPTLKQDYLDTGKIYFILRLIPTPPIQIALTEMFVAECVNDKNYFKAVDFFMDRQSAVFEEARQGRGREALLAIARGLDMNEKEFDACLKREDIPKKITAVSDHASKKYAINSTPQFIINGKHSSFNVSDGVKGFKAIIDPLLGEKNK